MTAKAAPPIVVATANLTGVTVPELVQYATLLYLVLLISHKVIQIVREWRAARRRRAHASGE